MVLTSEKHPLGKRCFKPESESLWPIEWQRAWRVRGHRGQSRRNGDVQGQASERTPGTFTRLYRSLETCLRPVVSEMTQQYLVFLESL